MVWMEPLLRPPPLPAALESMQHTAGSGGGGSEAGAGLGAEGAGWPPQSSLSSPGQASQFCHTPPPAQAWGTLGSLGRVGAIRYPELG